MTTVYLFPRLETNLKGLQKRRINQKEACFAWDLRNRITFKHRNSDLHQGGRSLRLQGLIEQVFVCLVGFLETSISKDD